MSDQHLNLKIITPQKLITESGAEVVYLPTVEGVLGVLPGHMNLVVAIGDGELTFLSQGREEKINIQGGWADIKDDTVIVFTELTETSQGSQPQSNESG
jgi:F0F1-type ATP synthase epsilon subunit